MVFELLGSVLFDMIGKSYVIGEEIYELGMFYFLFYEEEK